MDQRMGGSTAPPRCVCNSARGVWVGFGIPDSISAGMLNGGNCLSGLLIPLNLYRRPVAQDFGNALHDFGRIVADTDHSVPACLRGVLKHALESILPRLLAQF